MGYRGNTCISNSIFLEGEREEDGATFIAYGLYLGRRDFKCNQRYHYMSSLFVFFLKQNNQVNDGVPW